MKIGSTVLCLSVVVLIGWPDVSLPMNPSVLTSADAAPDLSWKRDDFKWIKGANYTPSYASNDVVTWNDFDSEVVDRELGYAKKLGLNSVRTWLQYIVYEDNPARFLENFETYLQLCDKHGIRAMPILFDSCFGEEPKLDWKGGWVASPGFSKLVPSYRPKLRKYLEDVVGGHVNDKRVAIWDIMNEPEATPHFLTDDGREQIMDHVLWAIEQVQEIDPSHPTCVGAAGGVARASAYADKVDVIAIHSYTGDPKVFKKELVDALRLGEKLNKPVLINECCAPGWGQDYEMVLPILREVGMPYYFWEVVFGGNQFKAVSGVLYPDGQARSLSTIAAVLNVSEEEAARRFKVKPADAEGAIAVQEPKKPQPFTEKDRQRLKELAKSPTTEENYEARDKEVQPMGARLLQAHNEGLDIEELLRNGPGAKEYWKKGEKKIACERMDKLIRMLADHSDKWTAAQQRSSLLSKGCSIPRLCIWTGTVGKYRERACWKLDTIFEVLLDHARNWESSDHWPHHDQSPFV